MVVTLQGDVTYKLDNTEVDEYVLSDYNIDMTDAIEAINNSLDYIVNSEEYEKEFITDYTENGVKLLHRILEINLDEDHIFVKLDIEDMEDSDIVSTFKQLINDIIVESDTDGIATVSGTTSRDDWNNLKGEYQEVSSYETWEETLSLVPDVENIVVIREEA